VEKNIEKYKCGVCHYVYDPERGDERTGIPAGTAFEDLPEDWICPFCRTSKSKFGPYKPRRFS
jgi:rubredoxin